MNPILLAKRALAGFITDPDATLVPIESGLINRSYVVSSKGQRYVLQRVHPVFSPAVNEDLAAVTAHLQKKKLVTPQLLKTKKQNWWHEEEGAVFRLMSFIDGVTYEHTTTPQLACEAGLLVAKFHQALVDFSDEFKFMRPHVHDMQNHLRILQETVNQQKHHPYYERNVVLAEAILRAATQLDALSETPLRVVHGDLKISNLLFDKTTGSGICLVDLDTVARMMLPLELGDAIRSWCNSVEEDQGEPEFDLEFFSAAIRGYLPAARAFIQPEEASQLVLGAMTIALELAARFCTDAFNENYFAWDVKRFPDRSTHNFVRAQGQLQLHHAMVAVRRVAEKLVEQTLS